VLWKEVGNSYPAGMNRGLLRTASWSSALVLACLGCNNPDAAQKGGAAPAPKAGGAADAPAPAKAEPFTVVDAWGGPALRAQRNFATRKVVFHAAAPTAGYQLSVDGIDTEGPVRRIKLTLLQPANGTAVAQVVTDTTCEIEDAQVDDRAKMQVVVRCMQKDAHYLVAPPWAVAMTQQ